MEVVDGKLGASGSLRNEPVQARSTARLTALLDAAASAIQDLGYERLTTAMVAERAGASIGTVYRYFPDRIAVLQALAVRNLDRVTGGIREAVGNPDVSDWRGAIGAAFDAYAAAFRSEPGFASLRSGDVIDLRPRLSPTTANAQVAAVMVQLLSERFGSDKSSETLVVFENAVEVMDALIARAFARDADGDASVLTSARSLVLSIVASQLG